MAGSAKTAVAVRFLARTDGDGRFFHHRIQSAEAANMPQIPEKVYFRIGETAELVGVEPHVLRFWETEFPGIKPIRATSQQRLYRRQDVVTFLEIKRLLYDEQYTIAGARKRLAEGASEPSVVPGHAAAPDSAGSIYEQHLVDSGSTASANLPDPGPAALTSTGPDITRPVTDALELKWLLQQVKRELMTIRDQLAGPLKTPTETAASETTKLKRD